MIAIDEGIDTRIAHRLLKSGSAPGMVREDIGTPAHGKVARRRQIDPTTCEREYTSDEIEFMRAMDEYKRKNGRQFPTWSEVLEVVRGMGYRRD
jgi:hypothetical protein